MRRLLLIALLLATTAQAQPVYKYWVELRDKGQPLYSLDKPAAYLSPRALERRSRLGIGIDSLDLPVNPGYIEALQRQGFTVMHRSKWLNGVIAYTPRPLPDGWHAPAFVRSAILCEASPLSKPDSSVPNYGYPLPAISHDTLFGPGYYGGAYKQIAQLNGQPLHRLGYQGQGVLVGVCDCGFPGVDTAAIFNSMRSEGRLLATRDFVWPTENEVFDIHSHGTHALSTMAALMPGTYVGTAPKASYILCRTENVFYESLIEEYNWVAAAEWLDSMGVDLISTSLGYFEFNDSSQNHVLQDLDGRTAPASRGAAIAATRGIIMVVSAGNDGLSDPQHLCVPADATQVLSVGAVDSSGTRAAFSSHGPTASGCIKPDVMAMGVEVLSASPDGLFRSTSGTSLACPVMAGMMACLRQRYPALTPAQLCDSVRSWGNRADSADNHSGYGIPDFSHAANSQPVSVPSVAKPEGVLRIFPNPSRQGAVAGLPLPGRLEVFDLTGRRVVLIEHAGAHTMLPSLPPGIYLLRATTSAGVYHTNWVASQ